jgi:hypothetical protein
MNNRITPHDVLEKGLIVGQKCFICKNGKYTEYYIDKYESYE